MITPSFELTQNEKFLIVSIQVPYAKVSDVQVEYEDQDFNFYSKPYFLRLNLPGKVVSSEEPSSIKYDFDKRIFVIHLLKAKEGEVFESLDLITKLLAPKKGKSVSSPLIEVIEGTEDTDSDEEFDWNIEQTPSTDEFGTLKISGQQCGFGNSYSFSVFNIKEETEEIFDVKEPESKPAKTLKEERLNKEMKDFNEDHYLADLYEDDAIKHVLKYQPEWEVLYEELHSNSSLSADDKIIFTTEEKDRLLKLPNKEYILSKTERVKTVYSLMDILFAYAYNKRTNEGENTIESAWTINKLSTTLSWLDSFTSITEVASSCIRRSLCYPLYRHFELSVTTLEDVRKILLLGRKYVIKCLLEIHQLFNLSEPRYILNDLFITDYCVWMQSKKCSSKKLEPFANELGKVLLTKGDIGLNLVDVESFAAVAWMSQASPKKSSAKNTSNPEKPPLEPFLVEVVENLSSLSLTKNELSDSKEEKSMIVDLTKYAFNESDFEICSSWEADSSDSSSSTYESSTSEENNLIKVLQSKI